MEWSARLKAFWVRRLLRRRILFRDRYGLIYGLEPTDDLALYFTNRGWFEKAEQEFCRRYLQPGMTAFDVGAYIGVYSLLMAQAVGQRGRIHAFEPSRMAFQRLLENIATNGFSNIVANAKAVFSSNGVFPLCLYAPPFDSLTTMVHRELKRGGQVLRPLLVEPVEAVSLDKYCQKQGIEQIDLLKLDAEGAELEALKGAQGLLQRGAIRCFLIEVGTEATRILDNLKGHGFRFLAVSNNGSLELKTELEVTRAVNVVALHSSAEGLNYPSNL